MKSLVVPVNFTDSAANAARYAADMALALEADIHLLHVLELPAEPPRVLLPYIRDGLRRSGQWMLHDLADELARRTKGQVTVTTCLEEGGVEAKIEDYCERFQPFLVIMGAPANPRDRLFNYSEAITAVRHLPYPLLVVPERSRFQAIHRITLACQLQDIKDGIPVSLSFLRELKEIFGSRFEVVHFVTGAGNPNKSIVQFHYLEQSFREQVPELHFIEAESVEKGVADYLASHAVDWLMIFPKKHRFPEFHKILSKRIVTLSPVPVLSICEHVRVPEVEKAPL